MSRTERVVGVALVLTAVCALAGEAAAAGLQSSGTNRPPARPRYASDAHAALAAGDARRALAILTTGTPRLPLAEHRSIEGRAHFMLGNYPLARRRMEAAVRERPKHAPDLYWLGRAYAACGVHALAASHYQEAYWNGLDTPDLHYFWAVSLKSLNELLGAISQRRWPDHLEEPPQPGSFSAGGLVVGPVPDRAGWMIVSPPNSAIYQVYRVLKADPHRGEALLLSGDIWAAVNRHEHAVTQFAKAAPRLDKRNLPRCYESWAASLFASGDYDGYLRHSREAMRLAGGIDSAALAKRHDRVAAALAGQGDLKRQIRYLTLATELNPAVERLIMLADALLQAHRLGDAERHLRTALEQDPSQPQRRQIALRLQHVAYLASPR